MNDETFRDKVSAAIETIRPALQADGGDLVLVDVTDEGDVRVALQGACRGCPMSQMTLSQGVERRLRELVPGVRNVVPV